MSLFLNDLFGYSLPNELADYWLPYLTEAELKIIIGLLLKSRPGDSIKNSLSVQNLQEFTGIGKSQIINSLKRLNEKQLIQEIIFSPEDALKMIKSKTPQHLPNGDLMCAWCRAITCVLHSHHYPVSFKNGGCDVVGICPSCHCEFHQLTETRRYIINKENFLKIAEVNHE